MNPSPLNQTIFTGITIRLLLTILLLGTGVTNFSQQAFATDLPAGVTIPINPNATMSLNQLLNQTGGVTPPGLNDLLSKTGGLIPAGLGDIVNATGGSVPTDIGSVLQATQGIIPGELGDLLREAPNMNLNDLGGLLETLPNFDLGNLEGVLGAVPDLDLGSLTGILQNQPNFDLNQLEGLLQNFPDLDLGDLGGLLSNMPDFDLSQLDGLMNNFPDLDLESLGDVLGNFPDLNLDSLGGLLNNFPNLDLDNLGDLLNNFPDLNLDNLGGLLEKVPDLDLGSVGDLLESAPDLDLGSLGDLLGNNPDIDIGKLGDMLTDNPNLDLGNLGSGALSDLTSSIGGALGGGSCGPTDEEKFECPDIDCGKDPDFEKRVGEYFTYRPPTNNRAAYLNKSYHDYELTKPSGRARPVAHNMASVDPDTVPNTVVNEAVQDNRWRDFCLNSNLYLDNDYKITHETNKPMKDEEPIPGVAGSTPIYKENSPNLNCIPPKNTELKSPLMFDNGWRYRLMCAGDDDLFRVKNDKAGTKNSILNKKFACMSPLPKCRLDNDWKRDSTTWIGKTYNRYKLKWLISTLRKKLKTETTSSQFQYFKDLFERDSQDPRCKPAFWVRLMLDSCANQFIARKTMDPDYVYNINHPTFGYSPRICQPFAAKVIPADEEEYDVHDYLERTHDALLKEDYMPWLKYERFASQSVGNRIINDGKNFRKKGEEYRDDNWPERQIEWSSDAKNTFSADKTLFKEGVSINDYAAHPVERIIDAAHPYSPRYDIAETLQGVLINDRNIFEGKTESSARRGSGKKYKCVPKGKSGYWEFGCTVNCSAVEVDLLRFRYQDFTLCMGCQIDTNEEAFWDEFKKNRTYYRNQYCRKATKDNDCEYGEDSEGNDICSSCFKKTRWTTQFGICAAAAIAAGQDPGTVCKNSKEKMIKWTKVCRICKSDAEGEALERTRERTNKKKEPEWGPTAMGDNWPVCQTRLEHEGDADMCKKAKEKYKCKSAGKDARKDPLLAKRLVSEANDMCIDKEYKDICHDAAKPVYSINFLKIRTRKGDFRTDQPSGSFKNKVAQWRSQYADQDPADGLRFREHFGNKRPYMRWWDTGKEAFQQNDRPDYYCDWGQNDAIMGVGRDYNSIHGRKAQLCRYGGGASVGGNCFTPEEWKNGTGIPNDRKFPSLAGTEWAELKLYQANCSRNAGMNCLCQYEKIFKGQTSEDKALYALGGKVNSLLITEIDEDNPENDTTAQKQDFFPLSWRGYASTPASRDTTATSPAIGINQQFPHLFGPASNASIISGGLDEAKIGDIVIYPAGGNAMPHVAIVEAVQNLQHFGGDIKNIPGRSRYITVSDANNGKFPDACGNTTMLNLGEPRNIYASKDEMPESVRELIEMQISSTYYCDDSEMRWCVERNWDSLKLYRANEDTERSMK